MDVVTLQLAKKYVEETMEGAGAIKGDKGDKGDPGPQGPVGPQGEPGPQGPAGSGADLSAGDGMSKDGDTLNVDNHVRGIYTQAEFNALTDEQKASGTYFVDDGQSGGVLDVYSTEERVVGTWIDGEPLYEKTYMFSGNIENSKHSFLTIDNNFHGHIINAVGSISPQAWKSSYALPYLEFTSSGDVLMSFHIGQTYESNDHTMWIHYKSLGSYTVKGYVTVRYIKNTDLEVTT